MTWSTLHIEEKNETNAEGRANQNKIKGRDSYGVGVSPGRLNLSVDYNNGCLTVFLDSARDLAGKRSQDPYAFCYLLDNKKDRKDRKTYFQVGNNKTEKFSKNLSPDFKHKFEFRMSLDELNTKSLVIAIWDEDSKSRDDYMAGFRLNLQQVQYFQRRDLVCLNLQHQDQDGHPAEVVAKSIFGIILGSWDLKTCNDHLVAFIDRARVLAEAYEIKGSLPSSLKEQTSMMPPDASRLFSEEIARLKSVINTGRAKLNDRRGDLDRLKTEHGHLNSTFIQSQHTLKERQSTLYSLELRESELSVKVVGLDHLREQIRILEMRITTERQRIEKGRTSWQEVGHIREEALYMPSLGGINLGQSKHEEEKRKIEIRIRNEFLLKMKAALNKARQSYQLKYQEFILKIERDADEVMRLYEDIIRERSLKGAERKNHLLDLERSRAYQLRIEQLLTDIKNFDSRIGSLEGKIGGLDGDFRNKLAHLDAELNALKQKLRDLFAMFSAFAQTRYNETNEVSIYSYLLGFEEGRLADSLHKVQRKVTVSESVVRASHAADLSIGGSSSSSFQHGYSVKSGSAGYKRESGYSSPANTPSSVHGGGMEVFDFPESVSYGEQSTIQHSSRSSRHSSSGFGDHGVTTTTTRSSRHSSAGFGDHGVSTATTRSSRDNLFDSIKDDIL